MKKSFTLAFAIVLSFSLQIPLKAQSQKSEDWTYVHEGDTIFGTQIIVENSPGVVLIVAGSGPTDRDGNNPMNLKTDAYKKLAEALAAMGWSSVRYDKRGIAASSSAVKNESDMLPSYYVRDIAGILFQLSADYNQMVLIGHSEGALLAGEALAKYDLSYPFISLEGPGRSLDVTLKEQLKTKLNSELYAMAAAKIDSIKEGQTVYDQHFIWMSLFRKSVQPYMAELFSMDPCTIYSQLNGLVYIVDGGHDIQITEAERTQLKECLPNAEFVTMPKMTHVLVDSENPNDTQVYNQPELPLSSDLIKALDTILNQQIHSGK
ncbi:MAG: alpha/beta hydrolase [Schleiferiaceae bacterium]